MRGCELALPEGFQGTVLERQANEESESTTANAWKAVGKFNGLHYWGHDTTPSATDGLRRALDWLPLAAAVHGPVQVSDVEAAMQNNTKQDAGT
jgi:hypothetical protein